MADITYVFPNTADIPQRGGLDERVKLAKLAGCSFIEIPADLVKNGTEVSLTGQALCTFLTKESIEVLYKKPRGSSKEIPYILHTEPSLGRTDEYGIRTQAQLRWYDKNWVSLFTRMLIDLSDFFQTPPAKIEIHPGDQRNTCDDLTRSIEKIQDEYDHAFGIVPELLLENRTGQFISDGDQIARFWEFVRTKDPELIDNFGIVLDVQQLATVVKEDFLHSFAKIPNDALKGFHIHTLHKPPKIADKIPWNKVFDRIARLKQDVIINPEIHHNNKVAEVIGFCQKMQKNP
jgi:hypothetical protein